MKKTYISPAVNVHKLRTESILLSVSNTRRTDFGNTRDMQSPFELKTESPDESYSIDVIEGDDWSTL